MAHGSIQKRIGKRGVTWTAVIDLPRDPVTGSRRQKILSAPTRKEAEALVTKTLHEINSGAYMEQTALTLAEYLPRWLEAAGTSVRGSTIHRYRQVATKHLIPNLGTVPLSRLTPLVLQNFYSGLHQSVSGTMVAHVHAILHVMLEQAVKWQMLRVNPCDAVDAPRRNTLDMKTWTIEQVRAFLNGTVDDPLSALWHLALMTGMRKGEMLALRWQDVDLASGNLSVRRTLTRDAVGAWTFNDPKTNAGRRQIALPESCVTTLKAHRRRQSEQYLSLGIPRTDSSLVFARADGRHLDPTITGRWFNERSAGLGLPHIRFHDLRHTAATLMLAGGIHPRVVQERLGHASIKMTLDRYSHVTPHMQRDAADRLDAMLRDPDVTKTA